MNFGLRLSFCLWLAALALQGCRVRRDDTQLQHNSNEVLRNPGRWQWLRMDQAAFDKTLLESLDGAAPNILVPVSDPMHTRLAAWLRTFNAVLLEQEPHVKDIIPEPNLRLVIDPDPNAYVTSSSLCVPVPIRLNGELPITKDSTVEKISLSTFGIIEPQDDDADCLTRPIDTKTIKDAVAWFNEKNPECQLSWRTDNKTKTDFLQADVKCPMSPALEEISWANGFTFESTTNWVVVQTSLIEFFDDEEKMLSIIAHELGHYYRSHHTAFDQEYNYFYDQQQQVTTKPVANPALASFGRQVFQGSRLIQQHDVEGQKLPSVFIKPAVELAASYCRKRGKDCPSPCKSVRDMAKTESYENDLAAFPDEELKVESKGFYQQLETKVLQCADAMPIKTANDRHSISISAVNAALRRYHLDGLFSASNQQSSLGSMLQSWTSLHRRATEDAHKNLKKAADQRLGFYTVEQEADEFGLELMADAGFDPEKVVTAALEFYLDNTDNEDGEPQHHLDGHTRKECEQLRSQKWPTVPPIADFYDDHHSGCYRVYNLDREIRLHKYVHTARASTPKIASAKDWNFSRTCARDFAAKMNVTKEGNGGLAAAKRKLAVQGCLVGTKTSPRR